MTIRSRVKRAEKMAKANSERMIIMEVPAGINREDSRIEAALEVVAPAYDPDLDLLVMMKMYGKEFYPYVTGVAQDRQTV